MRAPAIIAALAMILGGSALSLAQPNAAARRLRIGNSFSRVSA
jgi:hypothetical protein